MNEIRTSRLFQERFLDGYNRTTCRPPALRRWLAPSPPSILRRDRRGRRVDRPCRHQCEPQAPPAGRRRWRRDARAIRLPQDSWLPGGARLLLQRGGRPRELHALDVIGSENTLLGLNGAPGPCRGAEWRAGALLLSAFRLLL